MKKIILSLFALAMASSLFAQEDVKAVFEAGKKQLKERNIDFVYSVEDTSKNETAKEEN